MNEKTSSIKQCLEEEFLNKFLALSERDMDLVYLMVKGKPCIDGAYKKAKAFRQAEKGVNNV